MDIDILHLIIYTLITLAFSAYFSGMEIAFVSSNRMLAEMDKKEGLSQKVIDIFYHHPNGFVSTMLVGNNIALVIYGMFIAWLFDRTIFLGMPAGFTVPADTILSTIIVLFTGEFLPKLLFKSAPNRLLTIFSLPTFLFYIVLWPISKFATALSRLILRMCGVKIQTDVEDEEFSKVDLDYLVQTSIDNAENDDEIEPEVELFQNALDFAETRVRDCMVPRTEVDGVDIDECTLEELQAKFVESGHSKIIVFKDDIDHIIGYVHSSEMFRDAENWKKHINEMPFVPETMAAHKLMKTLMQQKKSLGVVVDEFGGTSGIISLEDIVEEIFGEIEDEHDSSNLIAQVTSDGEYILSARMEIDQVNEKFDLELPESDEYMTIGGLILNYYKGFPKLNEVVKIGKFDFKILQKSNTKIELVRLKVSE